MNLVIYKMLYLEEHSFAEGLGHGLEHHTVRASLNRVSFLSPYFLSTRTPCQPDNLGTQGLVIAKNIEQVRIADRSVVLYTTDIIRWLQTCINIGTFKADCLSDFQ